MKKHKPKLGKVSYPIIVMIVLIALISIGVITTIFFSNSSGFRGFKLFGANSSLDSELEDLSQMESENLPIPTLAPGMMYYLPQPNILRYNEIADPRTIAASETPDPYSIVALVNKGFILPPGFGSA